MGDLLQNETCGILTEKVPKGKRIVVKKGEPKLPPTGWRKYIWRAPIYLYRVGLGFLLGKRFLLLNHIGRKTGLPRQAVVEIARYDPEANVYYIASGFGKKSDWYRNLRAHPDVTIQVGNKKMRVHARMLSPKESAEEMARYVLAHPRAAMELAKIIGLELENPDDEDEWRTVGREYIPFVALEVIGEE